MMDSSWLLGAGTIIGLGIYLKSISDSQSTSARAVGLTEVNTELADSDKPSFSQISSTNPEYYQGSKDWVNTFDTSCGWTDDEQYCPDGILEAANCPTECTRPYYQTSMDLRKAQGWSEWTSPQAGDCGPPKFMCSTALIVNPKGSCPSIRARAKLKGGPIHTDNFSFDIEWQLYSFLRDCDYSLVNQYGWNGAGWSDNTYSVTIDEVALIGPAEISIIDSGNSIAFNRLRHNGVRSNRAINRSYNLCDDTDLTQSATKQTYTTDIDFSNEYVIDDYVGAYELSVQLNIGRDVDLVESFDGTILDVNQCNFNDTINITIPNFVFIGPPTAQCCNPLILEDRYEDPERPNFPHDKFYYDKVVPASGGGYKLETTNAWTAAPPANKCGSASPQIICTSDTASERASQTNNAETIFPRNGFMQW